MGATKEDMSLYGGKTADALEKDGYPRKDANRIRSKYGVELKPETGSTAKARQVTKPLEDVSKSNKKRRVVLGARNQIASRSLLG